MIEAAIEVAGFGIPENWIIEITLANYKIQSDLVYKQLDNEHIVAPFANSDFSGQAVKSVSIG